MPGPQVSSTPLGRMTAQPEESPDLLRSYLADRDAPCPNCGYNLRGVEQSSCPECGDSIALAVTNYPSRSRGYSAGLIGLSLTTALAVVIAIQNLLEHIVVSILSLFLAAWSIRAAVRWRQRRVAFSSLPRHKKQERVFVCWLGAAILLLFIFVEVQTAPIEP